jgi:hypothetical protein
MLLRCIYVYIYVYICVHMHTHYIYNEGLQIMLLRNIEIQLNILSGKFSPLNKNEDSITYSSWSQKGRGPASCGI